MQYLRYIYEISPRSLKFFMLNARAITNYHKRYRDPYTKLLEEYKENWYSSIEDIKSFQENRLTMLLLEAYDYCPWYTEIFKTKKISRADIITSPFDALAKIPRLTKEQRKENIDHLTSKNPKRKILEVGFTTGSTGQPTRVPRDQESISHTFALLNRYYWTIGAEGRQRRMSITGRNIVNSNRKSPPFWAYNIPEQQLLLSAYHLSPEFLPSIIDEINRFKPKLIIGYPSALNVLAEHILEKNQDITFTPDAISSTAETLFPDQRHTIEKAFKCNVYNQYASSEGSPFITQCIAGQLHLNLDTGVFEFYNHNGDVAQPGELAEMVVTSFRNFQLPLIRYEIGDMVELNEAGGDCCCGCKMPTIKTLLGRSNDVIVTSNGGLVGLASRVFSDLQSIKKGQVVQSTPDQITLKYVPGKSSTLQEEEKLILRARALFGSGINITIQRVNDIPLGPNGKYRAVIREFPL